MTYSETLTIGSTEDYDSHEKGNESDEPYNCPAHGLEAGHSLLCEDGEPTQSPLVSLS